MEMWRCLTDGELWALRRLMGRACDREEPFDVDDPALEMWAETLQIYCDVLNEYLRRRLAALVLPA